MKCKEKTTLKLSSNVISQDVDTRGELGWYVPVDLLPKGCHDVRLLHELSEKQRRQIQRELLWAEEIYEDKEKYPDKKENAAICKDCQYKDICF